MEYMQSNTMPLEGYGLFLEKELTIITWLGDDQTHTCLLSLQEYSSVFM